MNNSIIPNIIYSPTYYIIYTHDDEYASRIYLLIFIIIVYSIFWDPGEAHRASRIPGLSSDTILSLMFPIQRDTRKYFVTTTNVILQLLLEILRHQSYHEEKIISSFIT